MTEGPIAAAGAFVDVSRPPAYGADQVTVLRGSTFCISDRHGDIRARHSEGMFVRDTRILSEWGLRIDGRRTDALEVFRGAATDAVFVGRILPQTGQADSALTVVRSRAVREGMSERITVHNYASCPARVEVALRADADLADLFEVKEGRVQARAVRRSAPIEGTLEVMRGTRGVIISADVPGERTAVDGPPEELIWRVTVPARGQWSVTVQVTAIVDGLPVPAPPRERPAADAGGRQHAGPFVRTPDAGLARTLRRSVADLDTLRIHDPSAPGRAVVAAGAPWYMALFGRDSLLTSWMALPLDPALVLDTLHTLADYQGRLTDPVSEEQPGRIPHEVRYGPAAPLGFGERNAYYGTADATSLFVALVGELRRWGHDGPRVRALLPAVDRALEWVQRHGDADGDGFVEYRRATEQGLANQGWKDSWDGINHADGTMARPPVALAEVQGYTYAAYLARADLARDLGDPTGERRWRASAAALKTAFNRDFWLADRGWFAVGLDADKRPVDALTSNPGHCLWTGIVEADKAATLAERLGSARMSTGWGLRTLGSGMGAYNPVSYHNGSVWPHDTAICVAGLMRYGHVEVATRLGVGLLEAAARFEHRLPELFCGFGRDEFDGPVPYPTSCSPQAWSAAAPLLVLRALLGLDPDLTTGRVWCAPRLPDRYLPLTVRGVRIGERRVALSVSGGTAQVAGLDPRVTLIEAPRPAES